MLGTLSLSDQLAVLGTLSFSDQLAVLGTFSFSDQLAVLGTPFPSAIKYINFSVDNFMLLT